MSDSQLDEYENLYTRKNWEKLLEVTTDESAHSLYFKALALQELNRFEEALDCFNRMPDDKEEIPELYYNLGLTHYHLGNLK